MKEEITNWWLALINMRLKFNCLMANKHRYGHKGIDPSVVMKMWNSVLQDERGLPENWISDAGVSVGMRAGGLWATTASFTQCSCSESHTAPV